jgi:hypothetical protein
VRAFKWFDGAWRGFAPKRWVLEDESGLAAVASCGGGDDAGDWLRDGCAQRLSYLHTTGLRGGLLINFRVPVLRMGLKRLVL